jgi:hypothetical protein
MRGSTERALRWGLISLCGLALLTEFNNCGEYAQPANMLSSESSIVCDVDCVTPTTDNLAVKANLGGGAEYGVPSGLTEWNMGGDCNEGGFPYNTITWELYLNGIKVRDSNMTGMIAANTALNVNSSCINGRFLLYINLASIGQDPINRSGLLTGSGTTRASYDLYLQIYGRQTPSATPQSNTLTGRSHISLLAL